jgi:hypothetical protein
MKKQTQKTKVENSLTISVGGIQTGVTFENKKHINRYVKEKKKQKVIVY